MPPQKAERMFAMYSKSLLPLLCAHPQQDLVFCSYSSAQFSLASLCKYVLMYQCERQCLKGILQSNIQSLEVWGEVGRSKSWRRETRNSSEATDTVKGHLGDFGRPLQEESKGTNVSRVFLVYLRFSFCPRYLGYPLVHH